MPEATSNDHGVFEIIGTTRSMRRLKPDPVPDALIRKILEAAVCAPSGGNMQRWGFLVITDRKVKEEVAVYYRRAWEEHVRPGYQSGPPAPGSSPERFGRMLDAAQYLSEPSSRSSGMDHRLPHSRGSVWGSSPYWSGSSIYPAVQNMLLAARALGLGATLTTLILRYADEVKSMLGLPPDVQPYALLPIGWPMGRFGPVRRLDNVVYGDRWGEPYRGLDSA